MVSEVRFTEKGERVGKGKKKGLGEKKE